MTITKLETVKNFKRFITEDLSINDMDNPEMIQLLDELRYILTTQVRTMTLSFARKQRSKIRQEQK